MLMAYFDCFSGISGDMTLSALIDLGLDQDYLREQLGTLKLDGYSLNIRRSNRRGLQGYVLTWTWPRINLTAGIAI